MNPLGAEGIRFLQHWTGDASLVIEVAIDKNGIVTASDLRRLATVVEQAGYLADEIRGRSRSLLAKAEQELAK